MAKIPTYEEIAKKVAEKALDEFLYDGKSIREWIKIIASEDAISRKAVLEHICGINGLEGIESSNVFEKHYADFIKSLPSVKPKSEWEYDHEILKAYSDGANDMLDKIKAEMANHLQTMDICNVEKANGVIVQSELTNRKVVLYDTVLHIIDEYKEEGNREKIYDRNYMSRKKSK